MYWRGDPSNDLQRWMREDQNAEAHFTTRMDFYALPNDFPEYEQALRHTDPFQAVADLERAFKDDIDHHHFIPYIQLHEFEALLFCDPLQFEHLYLDQAREIQNLVSIAKQFQTPEHIDRGQETAPSKRIITQIPEYESQKAFAGSIVAEAIGLDVLRSKCAHFNDWISDIENLVMTAD